MNTLTILRHKLYQFASDRNLLADAVAISATPLSVEEAIGNPVRTDFPLLQGREVMIEADLRGAKGQAFTDAPSEFQGTLKQVLQLPLDTNAERALFVATLNAALRFCGIVEDTRHCRDAGPQTCALEMAKMFSQCFPRQKIGLVGLQPAILSALVGSLGKEQVLVLDRDNRNIGTDKAGVPVQDGYTATDAVLNDADVWLVTGTTLVNGTFDSIQQIAMAQGKHCFFFGVTIAGAAQMLGLNRLCSEAL